MYGKISNQHWTFPALPLKATDRTDEPKPMRTKSGALFLSQTRPSTTPIHVFFLQILVPCFLWLHGKFWGAWENSSMKWQEAIKCFIFSFAPQLYIQEGRIVSRALHYCAEERLVMVLIRSDQIECMGKTDQVTSTACRNSGDSHPVSKRDNL